MTSGIRGDVGSPAGQAPTRPRKWRILVAEDSPTQACNLQMILEAEGYEVVVAADGEKALALLVASPFDLVISDVNMPGMSGYDLTRQIKADPARRDVPVILLTALTDPMDIVQGLEAGADNFIPKSYPSDYLLGRVKSILEGRVSRRGGKITVGAEITFLDKRLVINADKEQILDLLLSTFEDLVVANRQLRDREKELAVATSRLDDYARQLEDRVRTTEGKYRKLMDQASDGIFLLDTAGIVREVNRQGEELLGEPAAQIVGRSFEQRLPMEKIDYHREQFQKLLATGSSRTDNIRVLRADGTEVIVDSSTSLVEVGDERVVLAIVRDATERYRSHEVASRLAAIVEESEDAIIGWTLDGVITSWNPGAERLYGYAAHEAVRRRVSLIVPADRHEEMSGVLARAREGGRIPPFETVQQRKDVAPVTVMVSVSPVRDPNGQLAGAAVISRDITEMKRLEEQFRQSQKMEAVGQLAGGVAHDFNNLLTIINGYSDLLLGSLQPGDPMWELLAEIHKAGERAGSLTRQLLAFSRQQALEPKVLDLNAVVADMEKMLRRLIGEDVVLTTALDPSLAPVKADPGQLEQVLMNLSVNARDAMPRGGRLTVETRNVLLDEARAATHPGVRPGEYVMLAVRDTGTGMDAPTKARIFEPFFTTKGPGKGTGLGLAVVHGIVKQSGGRVEVDSEVGKGTAFHIYLPVVLERVATAQAVPGLGVMPRGDETVLLVEDEDAVRALARHVLRSCGYTILEAADGQEAIRVAEAHPGPIDLLVSDVVMPHLGGRQLAERLAAVKPGMKVLFLSGYTEDSVVRPGALEAEFAFLQKPFTTTALAQKVRATLDQKP